VINNFVRSGDIKQAYDRALKRCAMELSFRTIRLFHVEDDDDKENVGDEEEGNKRESPLSIQLHDEDDKEDK
jgi:hypothetical protein